jgi:diguanylate cyclase (GGDEF)-like protein/PAS domain S-box-containing protein
MKRDDPAVRDLPPPPGGEPGEIRRLAVDDLDSSYAWLQTVAASTVIGLFVHDFERLVWVNEAVEWMTGYTRDELLALAPLDIVDPAARPYLDERMRERLVRRDSAPHRYEVKILRKDGGFRWTEASLTTLLYRGKLAGLGVVFDVTERRLAERALRESEERLQLAQQAGEIVVWDWDLAADRVHFSPNARELLRIATWENAPSREFFAYVHPQDQPRLQAALDATLVDDRDYFFEHRLLLPSGQTRWLAQRGRVIRDASGKPTRLLGVALDITSRKLAEEALFQEKERAQVTLASIGDGVIRTDARGMIEFMNPAAERLTGWAIHEAYGRHLRDVFRVVDPETHTALLDPVTRCLAEGRFVEFPGERLLEPRAGHPIAVSDSASPIFNRQGRTIGAVLAFKDVSELRTMERERSFLATHDPLTGLLDRRAFGAEVDAAVESARTLRRTHALLIAELDPYRLLLDTCGHFASDEALKDFAERLQAGSPPGASLARLGTSELGTLLPDTPLSAALDWAQRLRAALAGTPFRWQERSYDVSASIGLVSINADTIDGTSALAAADAARFAARQLGGNRVHEYRPGDDAIARRMGELQWAQEIRRALEGGRFRLFEQRIVPLHAGSAGEPMAEIFLRMLSESGDPVPTAAFIAAAERYNLMSSLDRWVMREGLAAIARQGDFGGGGPTYTLNLSGQSLGDDGFLEHVVATVEATGVDPRRVCFEITETAAIANLSSALRFMSSLRGLGCRFVLDDFGAGFSSFAYLKNLPVDLLKIDASFTHQLTKDRVQRALVESILQIARVLGMKTIAEGIEDEATLELLRELGVDYGQGFALHRPAPLRDDGPRVAAG